MIEARESIEKEFSIDLKDVLKVIARKGVSDILYSLERQPKRFSQLMFDTQLNPSILDRHLKALMKLELIEKEKGLYKLTNTGFRVIEMMDELLMLFRKGED